MEAAHWYLHIISLAFSSAALFLAWYLRRMFLHHLDTTVKRLNRIIEILQDNKKDLNGDHRN